MKCRSKEKLEYVPVEDVLFGRPDLNPDFKGFPAWLPLAFKDAVLSIVRGDTGKLWLLEIRGACSLLYDEGFVMCDEDGSVWVEDTEDFNRRYEIIV